MAKLQTIEPKIKTAIKPNTKAKHHLLILNLVQLAINIATLYFIVTKL